MTSTLAVEHGEQFNAPIATTHWGIANDPSFVYSAPLQVAKHHVGIRLHAHQAARLDSLVVPPFVDKLVDIRDVQVDCLVSVGILANR